LSTNEVQSAEISTWAYQDLPMAEALSSFSLKFTVHGLVADINIASIYPEFREASVKLHRRAIEASASAGAELYIIHPGYTAWSFCAQDALQEELCICLAVENMPRSDWLFFHRPDLDLHDNFGGNDDHLPLGRGCIDFAPVLHMIEEKGLSAALEQKTEAGVLESLEILKTFKAQAPIYRD